LKISVVRNITDTVSLVPRSVGRPLRILIVSSTPADLPWINAEQEVALLQRALGPAERGGLVRLDILTDPDEKELQHRLRLVRPHIFHFIGHGAVGSDGEGVVALADDDKKAVFVTASRFGTILRDHRILLSTLNSCFSGGEADFDMARSIARILVQHGVPVAIATAREVLDTAALQFAREFYSALIDGYPIEAAVVEARKLLSVKGWDWSAYVLYASADSSLLEFRVASSD
jgi:CHAT domain-containing protein